MRITAVLIVGNVKGERYWAEIDLCSGGISHGHDGKGPDGASGSRGMPWLTNKLLEARGEPQADFFFSAVPSLLINLGVLPF